jgi:hypothetical protein
LQAAPPERDQRQPDNVDVAQPLSPGPWWIVD